MVSDRDDGVMDLSYSSGNGKKWPDVGYVLEVRVEQDSARFSRLRLEP